MFDSPWHWAVVAIVAFILFFGWKQLPDMSRSLGRSLRIFKTEIKGMGEDDKTRNEHEADKPAEPRAIEGTPAEQPLQKPRPTPQASHPRPAPGPSASPTAPSGSETHSANGR